MSNCEEAGRKVIDFYDLPLLLLDVQLLTSKRRLVGEVEMALNTGVGGGHNHKKANVYDISVRILEKNEK
jgi:hypothetical protein